MPELPEVEITVSLLREHALDRMLLAVDVLDPRILQVGTPGEWAERLVGRRITVVRRKGKYFWLELSDGQSVVAHLRMTGKLVVRETDEEEPLRYVRFRAELSEGGACGMRNAECGMRN